MVNTCAFYCIFWKHSSFWTFNYLIFYCFTYWTFDVEKTKKNFVKLKINTYVIGVVGLFGYHFFYFLAIKNAPAIEANLLNYLWPLLIVLFSALLPNEKLKWFHILGTILALIGAFLLVLKDGSLEFDVKYTLGYIFALAAALIWSSYSVISKTLIHVPTFAVTGFCMITALFSLIAHLIFEQTIIPSFTELIASIMLGLGPVGGAFYLWDFALKNGDIKILGSLAYLAPLLSTLILVLVGVSEMTTSIAFACLFIILGSIISSKQYLKIITKLIFKPWLYKHLENQHKLFHLLLFGHEF